MSKVETLEKLLRIARSLNYNVRYDYLGTAASSDCQIGNQKWLILDLNRSCAEHLELVRAVIERELAHERAWGPTSHRSAA